jgi:hypothetical protein
MEANRERRLRRIALIVLGVSYLFSYSVVDFIYFEIMAESIFRADMDVMANVYPIVLLVTVFVMLAVLAVWHRWAFYMLTAYVLIIQVFCTMLFSGIPFTFGTEYGFVLYGFSPLTNRVFWIASGLLSNIMSIAVPLNFFFWLFPFMIYYVLRFRARKRNDA